MKTVHVATGKPYDIFIERGILDSCGKYVKQLSKAQKVVVITDTNVAPHYQWRILNALEKEDLDVKTFIFRAGEESKTLDTIAEIYKVLATDLKPGSYEVSTAAGKQTLSASEDECALWFECPPGTVNIKRL